jgi:hypothetical protein
LERFRIMLGEKVRLFAQIFEESPYGQTS